VTILISNTLGTALGDFVATSSGLGFERGALVFAGLLTLVAAAHFFTPIQKSVIFWAAYVLTRPLGATLGDTLTKSHAEGGDGVSRHHRYSLAGEPTGYPPGPGGSNARR